MSGQKIVVPEGMLKAATPVYINDIALVGSILQAALLWLSENPMVPTMKQAREIFMLKAGFDFDLHEWVRWGACEWQRRMFLAPEPEVPEEIKDLLFGDGSFPRDRGGIDACILEAYKRGRESR